VLELRDTRNHPVMIPASRGLSGPIEEFGLTLNVSGQASTVVDLAIAQVADNAGVQTGYVLTLRKAHERMRAQVVEDAFNATDLFEHAPMAMVQLDSTGHIIRVNQALVRESGVAVESLVGRTLTGLSMDPDPRIAGKLMHKLLQGGATVTMVKPQFSN